MRHIDAGHIPELLADDMAGAAIALRRESQLARVLLGVLHKPFSVLAGTEGCTTRTFAVFAATVTGSRSFLGVVIELLQMRQDRVWWRGSRRRWCSSSGAALATASASDGAAGPGLVLDDSRMTALGQLVGESAPDHIGHAASALLAPRSGSAARG